MTESYQSLGQSCGLLMAYLGSAFLLLSALRWLFAGSSPEKRHRAVSIGGRSLLLGAWFVLCGLIRLPISVFFGGFIWVSIAAALLFPGAKAPLFRLSTVLAGVAIAAAVSALALATFGDRKITLTDDKIIQVPTGLSSHKRSFFGQATRVDLHVDATVYEPIKWIDSKPFVEWYIWSGPKMRDEVILIGSTSYWGPHGLITSDELGEHIAAWAGVQAKRHPFTQPHEGEVASK